MTTPRPTHLHRRSSSKWVPPSAPLHNPISIFRGRSNRETGSRVIRPNHLFESPRYELNNYRDFTDNQISTTKYTIWNFIPLNIWHQISTKYANLYFIFIAVLNWVPFFDAYTRYVGLIPITFVLGTTLIKDGIEDYRRWKFDNQINEKTCHVWDRDRGAFRKTEWKYILVGDFVHISNDQDVPADIIMLRSSNESGTCYIETCNLDGETSLKQRMVPAKVIDYSKKDSTFKPSDFTGVVTCEKPDKSIYTIRAKVEFEPGESDVIIKENMLLRGSRIKNTTFVEGIVVYAGHDTKVMLNNGRAPHKTSGIEKLTNKFIIACFIMLLAMVVYGASASAVWVEGHPTNKTIPYIVSNTPLPFIEGFIGVGAFFINYQLLVPISLYITVEIIKALQIYFISCDIELYDSKSDRAIDCRSLSIPEELGTVTHVLSDKTGTLTENMMIFRNCAFDETDYGSQGSTANPDKPVRCDELYERINSTMHNPVQKHFFANILLNNSVVVNTIPHTDLLELGNFDGGVYNIGNSCFYDVTEEKYREKVAAVGKEPTADDDITRPDMLGLPNTIRFDDRLTVIVEEDTPSESPIPDLSPSSLRDSPETATPTSPILRPLSSLSSFSRKLSTVVRRSILRPISDIIPVRKRLISFKQQALNPYEAESPDELALIEGAALYNYVLLERAATSITISTPEKAEKRYDLLLTLPFDATRKRMSVIVNSPKGPLLYCKGADSAVMSRLTPESLSDKRVQTIQSHLDNYAKKGLRTLCFAMKYISQEEFDDFLHSYKFLMEDASTEREKMLSEKADELESNLKLSGVTGIEDRLQDGVPDTLCALRNAGIQVWVLTGDKLETAQNIATSSGLFHPQRPLKVIENEADAEEASESAGLNIILSPTAIRLAQEGNSNLIEALKKAKTVLCYRMTPSEKATMVNTVKNKIKGNVLAIGDGANDVPMIQAAHVGIGIAGKEGLQAAMACDFAIARFKFLSRLLLVHGHWSYYRLANTFLYFLYKNANAVFIIFYYQFFCGASGTNIVDPIWGVTYPIIFTSAQPVVVGVLDQDYDDGTLMSKPEKYIIGRENQLYTWKHFFIDVIDGIYQAAVIYYVAHLTLYASEVSLWEMGFYIATSSILVNSGHLALQVRYWHWRLVALFVFFIVLQFAYFFIECLTIGANMIPDPPVWMPIHAMGDSRFWYSQIITVIVALCPRFTSMCLLSSLNTGLTKSR